MSYDLHPTADAFRPGSVLIGAQRAPMMAALDDGGAIVVWTSQRDPDSSTGHDILAQRYDATGQAVGAEMTVYAGADDEYASGAVVAGLAGGGWAVSFRDDASDSARVRVYDAAGALAGDTLAALPGRDIGGGTVVDVTASGSGRGYSAITARPDGGFVLAWTASYSGMLGSYAGAQTTYRQAFDTQGQPLGGPEQVSPWVATISYSYDRTHNIQDAATLNGGNQVIVSRMGYDSPGNDTGHSGAGVLVLGPDGRVIAGPFLANQTTDQHMGAPTVAALEGGGFVVAWTGSTGAWWRVFAADGSPAGDEVATPRSLSQPEVSGMPDGGFLLTYLVPDSWGTSYSVRGLRYDAAGQQVGGELTIAARGDFDINYYRMGPQVVTLGSGAMLGLWEGEASWNGNGADVVLRLFMADRLGGPGDDVLTAAEVATAFHAGAGHDSLTGGPGGDLLEGEDGNDTLIGNGGDDSLNGGPGDDLLQGGSGDDALTGDAGNDRVEGGEGQDVLTYGHAKAQITVDGPETALVITTPEGVDTVSGVESFVFSDGTLTLAEVLALRNRVLSGSEGPDSLTGGWGDDHISGLGGNDLLAGGPGNDTLISGTGRDTLSGGVGDDVLRVAHEGPWTIAATVVNPLEAPLPLPAVWSLSENPNIEYSTERPHVTLTGVGSGQRYEAFSFTAVAGQTWIFDVDGAGFDSYLELFDAEGNRIAYNDDAASTVGGLGSSSNRDSYLSHSFAEGGSYVIGLRSFGSTVLTEASPFVLNISVTGPDLPQAAPEATGLLYGWTGNDRLEGGALADTLYGEEGNDTLLGGGGDDFMGGGAGDDLLDGGAGQDTIYAGLGNDTARGGAGDDALYGSAGRNQLLGEDGADRIYASAAGDFIGGGAGDDTVRGGDGADTIYAGLGDDNIGGGGGNDLIYGSAGANLIYAGLGNDTVQGGIGADTIYGSAGVNRLFGNDGNDLIYTSAGGDLAAGGAGNDTVLGAAGNDTIFAGLGNDLIGGGAGNDDLTAGAGTNRVFGGLGDDTLRAGTGQDVLNGGPGADVFVFASAAHIGIGATRDVIADFTSGVDHIDLTALATAFNGTAGLSGGGARSFFYFAAGGLLIGDQNGDGAADWVIELTGAPAVVAGDFLL